MYGILGKDFVGGNYVFGNVVTVFQKSLEGDHYGVYEISEVCVVFHFLRENVARIDDSRNVIDFDLGLVAFTKNISRRF